MNNKLKKLAERDEEVVLASGIPSTVIRTGSLQSTPGGERGFDFTKVSVQKPSLPPVHVNYCSILSYLKNSVVEMSRTHIYILLCS